MEDLVERVEISGAAMALVMRELGSSRTDCDGLLFGRLHRKMIQDLQDDGAESSFRAQVTAIITGCCCTGTLMSFYDGVGIIDDPRLRRLIGKRHEKWGGDPVIGWLVGRRNCSMRPSMRENVVTANLMALTPDSSRTESFNPAEKRNQHEQQNPSLGLPYSSSSTSSSSAESIRQHQPGSPTAGVPEFQPFLFMLLTENASSDKSIHTHQYRIFQYHDRTFQPRPLVIRNVGKAEQGGLYGGFVPVSPFPYFSSSHGEQEVDSWRSARNIDKQGRRRQQALLDMYAEGFSIDQLQSIARCGGGTHELELLYHRMLSKMQSALDGEVRQTSEAIRKQEQLNAKLRASTESRR